MDTKLINSKGRLIIKVLAFVLALAMAGLSAKTALDAYLHISSYEHDDDFFIEGAVMGQSREDFYSSEIFISYLQDFTINLCEAAKKYGDGSEKFYNSLKKENTRKYDLYRDNLLKNLYYRSNFNDEYDVEKAIAFLSHKDIVSLKEVKKDYDESSAKTVYLEEASLRSIFVYNCRQQHYLDYNDFDSAEYEFYCKRAEEYGSDILVRIDSCDIVTKEVVTTSLGGTYALTLNEDKLASALESLNFITDMGSYETFSKEYSDITASLGKTFRGVKYRLTLDNGTVVTNTKAEGAFWKDYDYYLVGNEDLTSSCSYDVRISPEGYLWPEYKSYSPDDIRATVVTVATTLPEEEMSDYETTSHYEEGVTVVDTYDPDLSAVNTSDVVICFDTQALLGEFSVHELHTELVVCGKYARDMAGIILFSALAFLALLILLIALCGNKDKEGKIKLLATDRLLFVIKTFLNSCVIVALGYCIFYFLFVGLSGHPQSVARIMYLAIPPIFMMLIAALTDYILYIARLVKAHRFLNSFLTVRLIKKLFSGTVRAADKIKASIKKAASFCLKPYRFIKLQLSDEKLFYLKSLNETVKIKALILLGINGLAFLFSAFLCALWSVSSFEEFFVAMLPVFAAVALDIYVFLRSLNFVGGVEKILEIIKQYRLGNLDAVLNRAGLPSYLTDTAEDLEGLSDGIRIAVNEAVRQETTKTELITNISHDLKTPLTSIINYVELLKGCDIKDETALSYLQVLGDKSDRLKHLITDLVEASKAATGNIEVNFVAVSLKEILSQLTGEFSDSFSERRLETVLTIPEEDIILKADSKLLYRVLENLMTNVRKYALEGTRVYIGGEVIDKRAVISIKNISSAPLNITPSELKQRFVRGDEARSSDGNGLGLSIAENLCIVQGGSLDIDITGDLFVAKITLEIK